MPTFNNGAFIIEKVNQEDQVTKLVLQDNNTRVTKLSVVKLASPALAMEYDRFSLKLDSEGKTLHESIVLFDDRRHQHTLSFEDQD